MCISTITPAITRTRTTHITHKPLTNHTLAFQIVEFAIGGSKNEGMHRSQSIAAIRRITNMTGAGLGFGPFTNGHIARQPLNCA